MCFVQLCKPSCAAVFFLEMGGFLLEILPTIHTVSHGLTLGKIVLMDLCGPPHVGPVRFLLCDFFAPALCYVYINTAAFGFFVLLSEPHIWIPLCLLHSGASTISV